MPTNLDLAVSKLLHPSNSKKFFTPEEWKAVETLKDKPFPMVEFLREELPKDIEPEYADDDLTNEMHPLIMHVIQYSENDFNYQGKHNYLLELFFNKVINADEFMFYARKLSEYEVAKQVVENPDNTRSQGTTEGKLPSQSVNEFTATRRVFTGMRGILSTVKHRIIASTLWRIRSK